jgi:hypothetical protein
VNLVTDLVNTYFFIYQKESQKSLNFILNFINLELNQNFYLKLELKVHSYTEI